MSPARIGGGVYRFVGCQRGGDGKLDLRQPGPQVVEAAP